MERPWRQQKERPKANLWQCIALLLLKRGGCPFLGAFGCALSMMPVQVLKLLPSLFLAPTSVLIRRECYRYENMSILRHLSFLLYVNNKYST